MLTILTFIIIYISLQLIVNEFSRRSFLFLALFYILIPIYFANEWNEQFSSTFFLVKHYSLLVLIAILILFKKYSYFQKCKIAPLVFYLLLQINILEAVLTDVFAGFYVNGISGVILMITIPIKQKVYVDNKQKTNDLKWDLPLPWIIGYTLWNHIFVYGNYPHYSAVSIATLIATLIIGIINNKLWFQARAYLLMTTFIFSNTFWSLNDYFLTPKWESETVYLILLSISTIYVLFYFLFFLKKNCL